MYIQNRLEIRIGFSSTIKGQKMQLRMYHKRILGGTTGGNFLTEDTDWARLMTAFAEV